MKRVKIGPAGRPSIINWMFLTNSSKKKNVLTMQHFRRLLISISKNCKSNNARFTTVPLKIVFDQYYVRNDSFFLGLKRLIQIIPICFSAVEMRRNHD